MQTIALTIDNKTVNESLKKLADSLEDTAPVMAAVANDMHVAIEQQIETEGHGAWAPLAKSTQQQRARRYGAGKMAHPILQQSGQMVRSIMPDSDEEEARVVAADIKAAWHHFGATINHPARSQFTKGTKFAKYENSTGGRTIGAHTTILPARPIMVLDDQALDDILDTINSFIDVD